MKQLPDELILLIISYLEPAELVNLTLVSRALFTLARDNNLWKNLCFSHSVAERRRRRLESSSTLDPRLAELVSAANSISDGFKSGVGSLDAPSAEAQQQRNAEKRRQAVLANWDPSYPGEDVNWYRDFVQRHAPVQLGWFEGAGGEREDDEAPKIEATGAGILYGYEGLAEKLIAPLDDGSIRIWDASEHSSNRGRIIAQSPIGLLSNKGSDFDLATRLAQSRTIMTETGAVECVSIDGKQHKAFFAITNTLTEIDLSTLQIVSRTPYPFAITALSEAHDRTPLTVGTNWTLHLHDTRCRPPPAPTTPQSTRCELLNSTATTTTSTTLPFSRLTTGDFNGHVSLSQPGALSILHLPTTRDWDGNGEIWVGGRFTSMLNFDRRFFPRLRGTVFSGARLSCLSAVPYPFVPSTLRTAQEHTSSGALAKVKERAGWTILAVGEYKGKGSLELYGLSSEPGRGIISSDNRSTRNSHACYLNRQTASASKLLSVASHGTRIVFADGDGGVKWVERDGTTPVRAVNLKELAGRRKGKENSAVEERGYAGLQTAMGVETQTETQRQHDDIVQKILPTTSPSLVSQPTLSATSSSPTSMHQDTILLWTGDGALGSLSFGSTPTFEHDEWYDALEKLEDGGEVKEVREKEREYGREMRRVLEGHARELRWMRGYGL